MTTLDQAELRDAFRRLGEEYASRPDAEPESRHLTRQSLAARHFVSRVGGQVRFDHARGEWFLWHGHRWHRDRDGGIRRLWLDVLAERYRDALLITDGDARDRAISAIHAAGALDSAISAGLRIAADSEPVALTGDEWDPDPWLLGCENGVVDLRTGELRPGDPDDLTTRSTHLPFDPEAMCPRWDRFLLEVFDGDVELVEWFQRLIGASLVGRSKEIVPIRHGDGHNGKSVCFGALGHVCGDYAVEIAIETLISARRDAGAATSDLMRLRGTRLAYTSEPDEGARLKGGTLKRLASVDKMQGRELHGRQQEWAPTHTLHVATNHLPEAEDGSEGFWRRIALVPWAVRFVKPGEIGDGPPAEAGLQERLVGEGPGVLGWVVRGAVAFASGAGLFPFPAAVARETDAYRADEDVLREFVAEAVRRAEDDRPVTTTALHKAYSEWASRAGLEKSQRLNPRRFGRMFSERHKRLGWSVEKTKVAGTRAYRGIRIVTSEAASDGTGDAGGDGGFGHDSGGSSYGEGESANSGRTSAKGTKGPRDTASSDDREGDPPWDEELAERATDDDGEGHWS